MKKSVMPDLTAAAGHILLIALSGGADSVALASMLAEARDDLHLTLTAAHVEHGLRGEASLADADFCRSLCEKLEIPFLMEHISVARQPGEGIETAARRERYAALRRMQTQADAEWIALAHHRDDQAETVLMHLLRGCGPEGIGGMETLSGDLYRPLLNTPKRELEDYLRGKNLPWRTDTTNLEPFTPRNALRLNVLPALEESYPSAGAAIARYAEAASCENRFMEMLTGEFLKTHLERGPYGMRILSANDTDEAILRRAIRRICGPALSHDKLLEMVNLPRGRLEIHGSLNFERIADRLYFLPKRPVLPEPAPLNLDGKTVLEGLGTMQAVSWKADPIRRNPCRQVLRRDALEGAALRTRRDGDRIRPLGCGERLLSDYLTDKKIDRPLRDTLPLVAIEDRILWVVGVGIAEDAKLLSEQDDAVLLDFRHSGEASP